tara:strand:- start:579 stop:836 length:258 start_codon:yes stop_codon:yes gene_type:complete
MHVLAKLMECLTCGSPVKPKQNPINLEQKELDIKVSKVAKETKLPNKGPKQNTMKDKTFCAINNRYHSPFPISLSLLSRIPLHIY